MTELPLSSDWAASRGEKWRSQIAGMEAMLSPIDEPLIARLKLDGPCRIADVGCGGGATAMAILDRAPARSVVHGFDVSPSLVEVARGRVATEARPIRFELADMSIAAPAEKPYERMASRFGIMFFADAQAAFGNLARWLSSGGRFAFAVWGPIGQNLWFSAVRDEVAKLVSIPEPEPDAPGPFRYGEVGRLLHLLEGAGFRDVEVEDWRGPLPIGGRGTPEEAAAFALAAFSSFGELLAQTGPTVFDQARLALSALFSRHLREGKIQMDACVHIVSGTKP